MNKPDDFDSWRMPDDGSREKVVVIKDTKVPSAAMFVIEREDHTLGHMMRTCAAPRPVVIDARARACVSPMRTASLSRVDGAQAALGGPECTFRWLPSPSSTGAGDPNQSADKNRWAEPRAGKLTPQLLPSRRVCSRTWPDRCSPPAAGHLVRRRSILRWILCLPSSTRSRSASRCSPASHCYAPLPSPTEYISPLPLRPSASPSCAHTRPCPSPAHTRPSPSPTTPPPHPSPLSYPTPSLSPLLPQLLSSLPARPRSLPPPPGPPSLPQCTHRRSPPG